MKIKHEIIRKVPNYEYANLFKRTRISMGKTLKEASRGICTPSYLSRIENGLVNVSEDYYTYLFKKLDLDFELIKEERNSQLFLDIAKSQLLGEKDKITKMIKEAFEYHYYSEIEYDLLMLFDDILQGLLEEASLIIDHNENNKSFTEEESYFFLYCKAYLLYKKGLYVNSLNVLLALPNTQYENYNYLVADLVLDIAVRVSDYRLFNKYYQMIYNDNFLTTFNSASIKHRSQLLVFEKDIKLEDISSTVLPYKEAVNDEVVEELDWVIMLSYYYHDIDQMFRYLKQANISPRIIAAAAIGVLVSNRKEYYDLLIMYYKSFAFKKYDQYYQKICELCIIIFNQDFQEAYYKAKEIIMLKKNGYYDAFFYNIVSKILMSEAIRLGKYKDGLVTIYQEVLK